RGAVRSSPLPLRPARHACRAGLGSGREERAVHDHDGAVHVGGELGAEEQHDARDLVRRAEPASREALHEVVAGLHQAHVPPQASRAMRFVPGVTMPPGTTTLALIPFLAYSLASARVRAMTAALHMLYVAMSSLKGSTA